VMRWPPPGFLQSALDRIDHAAGWQPAHWYDIAGRTPRSLL